MMEGKSNGENKVKVKDTVLVTGATGFVGRFLCVRLLAQNLRVRGTLLSSENPSLQVDGVEPITIEPLGANTMWNRALVGVDTVIHLAARVHVMQETAIDPLLEFRNVNLRGTEHLARQAAQAGLRRFVFMSTIGVNGDNSGDCPYTEKDDPNPHNPYSASKYEAEVVLRQISQETGMEVVIIRAPLVYGPGNPGNFLSLLRVVSKLTPLPLASITNKRNRISNFGFSILSFWLKILPLPLASIENKRSLIYVGNLVDALAVCATSPVAAGKTYLVSDDEDVSTPELLRRVAQSLGVPVRLMPFPVFLMRLVGKLTGKVGAVNRLTGSLTVDSSKIREELGWSPPFSMDDGLKETAEWFARQVKE